MQTASPPSIRHLLRPPKAPGRFKARSGTRPARSLRSPLFILTILATLVVWGSTGPGKALASRGSGRGLTGSGRGSADPGRALAEGDAEGPPAHPQDSGLATAFLHWDSSRRELVLLRRGEEHRSPIPGGTALEFEDFRRRLARSAMETVLAHEEEAALDSMAAELGEILFGDLAPWLEPARRWVIGPLSAAPMGALRAPWQDGPQRLVDTVVLSYVPGDPASTQAAKAFHAGPAATGSGSAVASAPIGKKEGAPRDLLAVLPYTPGFTPVQDDPDTLLWMLRPLLRSLDTLPRSQTSTGNLRAICAGQSYRIVLLRSRPAEADSLLSVLDASTRLVWWIRPPREANSLGARTRALALKSCLHQLENLCRTKRGVVADLWPRPDAPLADGGRIWIEDLRDSSSVAQALAHARRALKRRYPHLPGLWAGWIAAGEVDTEVDLQQPGFLQRLFPRRE